MNKIITTLLIIASFCFQSQAQVINNAFESQSPCNAMPICGVNTLTVPYTYSTTAPFNVNPGGAANCNNAIGGVVAYTPNWVFYRFKCFGAGTLQFTITPNDPVADMDWAIWDITVSGCGNLNAGNILECNSFAGAGGTGMAGAAAPGFETPLALTAGNTYILGISRKVGGLVTTGYSINFTGTTANLTDNTPPALGSILPFNACGVVNQLKVKLTKPVRCTGIQTADFSITGNPTFTATAGIPCPGNVNAPINTGINYSNATDTVILDFPTPLAPGTYTLSLNGGVPPQPFFDLCANLANVVPTLVFTVPNSLDLTIGTSINCANGQYIDTAKAAFGAGPYQYKIAGPGQPNTYGLFTFGVNVFSGLVGGNTYTITVRDANLCLDSVVIFHPVYFPMNILTFKKNPPCNNQFMNDTLRVTTVNGGSGPFTFSLASFPPAGAAGCHTVCLG
ncbi:MAG: hypothetical protein IPK62_04080 [Bacteroidetes bacterium]|nr:hypothetical protein [Bacteroidota bacterium]